MDVNGCHSWTTHVSQFRWSLTHSKSVVTETHTHSHFYASNSHLLTHWPLFPFFVICSSLSLLVCVAAIFVSDAHVQKPLPSHFVTPPLHFVCTSTSTPAVRLRSHALNLEWTVLYSLNNSSGYLGFPTLLWLHSPVSSLSPPFTLFPYGVDKYFKSPTDILYHLTPVMSY